jgi:hypothetical protein
MKHPSLFVVLLLALALASCVLPSQNANPPTPIATTDTPTVEGGLPETTPPDAVVSTLPAPPTEPGAPAAPVPTQAPQVQLATPLAATATAAPATQPPPPPTAGPNAAIIPANATYVQFTAGAASTTVAGELAGGQANQYAIKASAGQSLSLKVWSPNNDVFVAVTGADGKPVVQASANATQWSGALPGAQDYLITITASKGQTSFSLEVGLGDPSKPTPTRGPRFDPYTTYGDPKYEDEMNSIFTWARDGVLPDNDNLRLVIKDYQIYVTGKKVGFATWWFSWPIIKDFYIEMTANTNDACAGKDAYGLIIRGPERDAGVSYGYVLALSCDGSYWFFRLNGADPYEAKDLISWTASDLINTGPNRRNVIGVKADGSALTIFINGYEVGKITDEYYTQGRFGVFVRADSTPNFTFRPVKIVYWLLEKKK